MLHFDTLGKGEKAKKKKLASGKEKESSSYVK
jgi:hypothetical protein